MADTRREFDQEFRAGAVRIVRETGRPVAQVAKELGINEDGRTLGLMVHHICVVEADQVGELEEGAVDRAGELPPTATALLESVAKQSE